MPQLHKIIKHSKIIEPHQAYFTQTERTPLSQSIGCVSATTLTTYPPGVPIIYPGTVIRKHHVQKLEAAFLAGETIIGIDMGSDCSLEVVAVANLVSEMSTSNRYEIRTMRASEINRQTIFDFADFFAAGFAGPPYNHFAFHESDPLTSYPPHHTFDKGGKAIEAKAWYDIDELERIKLKPVGGFHRWVDRNKCQKEMIRRFNDDGYVTLVIDPSTENIKGILHARVATVKHLYNTEEWADPLIFSTYQEAGGHRGAGVDEPAFFNKMQYHFGLSPSDKVCTISAQLLHPDIRGTDIFFDMMKSMANLVTPEHASLPLITEIPNEGTAHIINIATMERLIHGTLPNGHPLVFSKRTSNALFYYIARSRKHWKRTVLYQARLAKGTINPHPKDNSNVEIRHVKNKGQAVYAKIDIKAGETIAVFVGETYQSDLASELPTIMVDHALQIGPTKYVHAHRRLAELINHSCNPNCGIRNYTEVFAVQDIKAGEEITWDYRCTEDSDWVLDNCQCGADRCTDTIANFSSLPSAIKIEYFAKGMVSSWIIDRNN